MDNPYENVKPKPDDTIGCVNCQVDFELPQPSEDDFYVPTCPKCGTVIDGYREFADAKRRHLEASEALETIEDELSTLINQTKSIQMDVKPGGGIKTIKFAAKRLDSISQFANEKSNELSNSDR